MILKKRSFKELFEKIDVAKEGLIDWNKFVDHMLLEFYEEDEKVKDIQVITFKKLILFLKFLLGTFECICNIYFLLRLFITLR